MSNEKFVPIVGLESWQCLEGNEHKFREKVIKAFRRGDEYIYRFGGVEINGHSAIIWVREAFGGLDKPSKPFFVSIHWTAKTSIKTILETMREQGYGTREFDRKVENE